jgi:hypothetical protein
MHECTRTCTCTHTHLSPGYHRAQATADGYEISPLQQTCDLLTPIGKAWRLYMLIFTNLTNVPQHYAMTSCTDVTPKCGQKFTYAPV